MRALNPWTQRILPAKPRGKPATSFFCDYPQMVKKSRARGDPKGIPRDPPDGRSRGILEDETM